MPTPSFWKPKPLSTYETYVQPLTSQLAKYQYAAAKNIGYNLQYVEYLVYILDTEDLHSVVERQIQKTLVITSVSIVESIFYCVLKKENSQSTSRWEPVGKPHKTSTFTDSNGKKMMLETSVLEEVKGFDVEMTLDTMTKKVEKRDLLGTGHDLTRILTTYESSETKYTSMHSSKVWILTGITSMIEPLNSQNLFYFKCFNLDPSQQILIYSNS